MARRPRRDSGDQFYDYDDDFDHDEAYGGGAGGAGGGAGAGAGAAVVVVDDDDGGDGYVVRGGASAAVEYSMEENIKVVSTCRT